MNDGQRFNVDLPALAQLLDRRPDVTPHPLIAHVYASNVAGA